jgi:hypothetical protein
MRSRVLLLLGVASSIACASTTTPQTVASARDVPPESFVNCEFLGGASDGGRIPGARPDAYMEAARRHDDTVAWASEGIEVPTNVTRASRCRVQPTNTEASPPEKPR